MGWVRRGGKGECWVLRGEKTGAGGAEVSQVSEARPRAPSPMVRLFGTGI